MKECLNNNGVSASISKIHRIIKEMGYSRKKMIFQIYPSPALSIRHLFLEFFLK
jgi:hypothetical protein